MERGISRRNFLGVSAAGLAGAALVGLSGCGAPSGQKETSAANAIELPPHFTEEALKASVVEVEPITEFASEES